MMASTRAWFSIVLVVFQAVYAAPGLQTRSSDCTGTISSLSDVSTAVKCTTIDVNGFTVPAGSSFTLNLLSGTTVNIREIMFKLIRGTCTQLAYGQLAISLLERNLGADRCLPSGELADA